MIFVGQISSVLGVSIVKSSFLQTLLALLHSLHNIHWGTFIVVLVMLAILLFLPRVVPKIPASLMAVLLGILASVLLNVEYQAIALVRDIPSKLPSLTLPDLTMVSQLWPGALHLVKSWGMSA